MDLTPREAAAMLKGMAERLEREILEAQRTALRYGIRVARSYSSGVFSSADLRRMRHPYRRGGTGAGDPGIINRQTGRFLASWKTDGPERSSGGVFGRIYNDAHQAGYLQSGTRRMVARPIKQRVLRFLEPATYRLVREAIVRALRG